MNKIMSLGKSQMLLGKSQMLGKSHMLLAFIIFNDLFVLIF